MFICPLTNIETFNSYFGDPMIHEYASMNNHFNVLHRHMFYYIQIYVYTPINYMYIYTYKCNISESDGNVMVYVWKSYQTVSQSSYPIHNPILTYVAPTVPTFGNTCCIPH